METKDNSILKLLSSLAKCEDQEKLLKQFCEGLCATFANHDFRYSGVPEPNSFHSWPLQKHNNTLTYLQAQKVNKQMKAIIDQAIALIQIQLDKIDPLPDKKSNDTYKRLFKKNKDAIYMLNNVGKVIDVNNAACEMLGYSKDELLQKSVGDIDVNYDQQMFYDFWQQRKEEGYSIAISKHIDKNGNIIPVEINGIMLIINDEKVFFGMARDIRQRLAAEEKLKEKEARYRFLAESSGELIALHEPDGTYQYISPSVIALLGYKVEELLGTNPYELFHEDDKDNIARSSHQEALKGNTITGIEYRIRHKNGSFRWFDTYTDVIIGYDGKVKNLISRSRDITDKKEAELRLQESEEKFRLLFENMSSALAFHQVFTDENNHPVNFNYIEVNPAFEKLTGLKAKDIVGKMVLEVLPDLEPYWIEKFGSVALTGKAIEYTNYVKELDRYYDTRTYSPKKGYFAVNFFEATDRIKAEQALRKSEEKYKFLAENTSDMVIMHDMRGYFDYISPVIESMLGYTPKEYKKFNPIENVHPEDRYIVQEIIDEFNTSQREYAINEYRIKKKDGNYIWIESRSKAMRDDNNELLYMISSSSDITERKRAEMALAESEEVFRNIFEYAAIGIAYISNEGSFLKVNEKYGAITGFQIGEFSQLKIKQITHPTDYKNELVYYEKIARGEIDNYKIEKRIFHKKGHELWVAKSVSVIKDSQGNIKYTVSAIIDITEQKNFEKQLQKINQRIGKQNQQYQKKNKELERLNSKVMEVNNKLKKVNQELDSFVYRVSHDLRAPITSSLGLSDLILANNNLDEIKKYSHLQKESLFKLDQFIKDILNYSRNTRMEVLAQLINFSAIVDSALEENRFALEKSSLEIIKEIPEDYQFYSDTLRLNIIIKNLLSNAIKFMNPYNENPFVKISIKVKNNQAKVEIKDNGIGIEAKHLPRIFEMFYRATDKKPGSGIGLYILKDCLDKINGKINIESEYGKGSKFILSIPGKDPTKN